MHKYNIVLLDSASSKKMEVGEWSGHSIDCYDY